VHEHDTVPGGNGLYRVFAITSRSAPGRAEVMFATTPRVDGNPNDPAGTAIVLAQAGSSPQIETAWDLRVICWTPDLRHPQRVSLEWWPAVFGRADADPASIRQANAELGTHLAVGGYHLSVLALRAKPRTAPPGSRCPLPRDENHRT
jgi:hypothetical protein